MKAYIFKRDSDGTLHITVEFPPEREHPYDPDPYPLPHLVAHSPTGMEVGYGGSGPADTALSILADHFGELGERVLEAWRGTVHRCRCGHTFAEHHEVGACTLCITCDSFCEWQSRAFALHQYFKWSVVSKILIAPGSTHRITEEEIAQWITEQQP